ncbi:succinyl-diaminopimelate desuccinylase [Thiohalorhabdus denitrificans]|uniref:Succinyl-diaminopimelate desuccinylase n=1 Tax=Thiohalorhabdus denitrificans TaxID=381306 RepID=A0A0P9ENX4_9GAMM|nr:succinyl-diaminopimelate desuccinylase [Thiohalorhabdus denitrificans]KPV40172.1 succinyl-diaminopimelate desuccinylase [Thiohalorhabdus denitrificans]SCY18509.1 succinyldiaminopimelate desuccinylase [Thiohalorhabdus denitrificans]
MTDAVTQLTRELIAIPSVTPDDGAGQAPLRDRLAPLGFQLEDMSEGNVANLYARYGNQGPVVAFAGHTDVVPTGAEEDWTHPPFSPTASGAYLYGRGAADMKGSLAAFTVAVERFLARHPEPQGSIALLITGDEEGPAVHGTPVMVRRLAERDEMPDYCLVGEPSCSERLGDTVKNGRRGSLTGEMVVLGTQGHVAYPHKADNPVHRALPALQELVETEWDAGNAYFPPTSFQIPNVRAGTGAHNVIPGTLDVQFNFRYSTERTKDDLKAQVHEILDRHGLRYDLHWHENGDPFLTEPGPLVNALTESIRAATGVDTHLSTAGGTSDGRFIAPHGVQVAEFGPLNDTIHQVDERVAMEDLERLAEIYEGVLERLLTET